MFLLCITGRIYEMASHVTPSVCDGTRKKMAASMEAMLLL